MDEMVWVILIVSLVFYLLIAPALGLVAFSRVRGLSRMEFNALRRRTEELSEELSRLRRQFSAAQPETAPEASEAPPEEEAPSPAAEPVEQPERPEPVEPEQELEAAAATAAEEEPAAPPPADD